VSLRKRWGVPETREIDSVEISKYFRKTAGLRVAKFLVDDRTWTDLNMDLTTSEQTLPFLANRCMPP
jgi:hypothetical protein